MLRAGGRCGDVVGGVGCETAAHSRKLNLSVPRTRTTSPQNVHQRASSRRGRTLVESAAHGRRERGEHAHGLCAARELGEARQQGRTKSRRSTVVVVAQCAVLARSTKQHLPRRRFHIESRRIWGLLWGHGSSETTPDQSPYTRKRWVVDCLAPDPRIRGEKEAF